MAKRKKNPTIEDFQKSIQYEFQHWQELHDKGGVDPSFADGTNMNLTRNHISDYQRRLKELCKAQKIRPCPPEARLKLPKHVPENYCAPWSKAGPCKKGAMKQWELF